MFWREKSKGVLGEIWVLAMISLFFLALYLPNLGGFGLYDPWETHYGEVARQMVESENYIDPYWGSPWDDAGVKREREGFYSKPPFTMWMMAAGMKIFGYQALGVRFFFPILTIIAILSVYLTLSRIISRRAGLLSALIYGLNPFTAFLSHQAVTDTPLLALITMGMMSLALAFYEGSLDKIDEDQSDQIKSLKVFVLALFASITFVQFWIIWPMDRSPDAVRLSAQWLMDVFIVLAGKGWAWTVVFTPLALFTCYLIAQIKHRSLLYFILFYIFCGLTVPAKGWLGWAPMGGALVLYLMITREWQWLTKVKILLGLLVVFLTGHIWVVAMLGGHHPEWVTRFIYHDHINRLFSGVHSTDDGAFEYFFQWIGYGLLPLIAFLPAAFSRVLAYLSTPIQAWTKVHRFELLMYLWALIGFFLFSKSSTKFHHYILPIIPAFVILIAIWLDDLIENRIVNRKLFILSAFGICLWVGLDVYRTPANHMQGAHHWINLFTYKYDREWLIPETEEQVQKLRKEALKKQWETRLNIPFFDQNPLHYDDANPHPFRFATQSAQSVQSTQSQALASQNLDPFWHQDLMQDEPYAKAMIANAWHKSFQPYLQWSLGFALLGILILLRRRWMIWGLSVHFLGALILAYFCIHEYLPKVSRHWSQEPLWEVYDQECTAFVIDPAQATDDQIQAYQSHLLTHTSRVPAQLDLFPRKWCKEPIIAFRMNWRGETFYSSNTTIPILETKYFKTLFESWGIWQEWQEGKEFFLFSERARVKSELNTNLPAYMKGEEWRTELWGSDRKLVLFKFAPPKGWKKPNQ
jgi:4-amino-4-deoxy-L-arabinose transferase-like glycosyltransferase